MTPSQKKAVENFIETRKHKITVLSVTEDDRYRTVCVNWHFNDESRLADKLTIFGAKGGMLRNG